MNFGEEILNALEGVEQVDGVDTGIAQVGDIAEFIGVYHEFVMSSAYEGRLVPDLSRTVPCASSIGRAAIPRNADQADVATFGTEGPIRIIQFMLSLSDPET